MHNKTYYTYWVLERILIFNYNYSFLIFLSKVRLKKNLKLFFIFCSILKGLIINVRFDYLLFVLMVPEFFIFLFIFNGL